MSAPPANAGDAARKMARTRDVAPANLQVRMAARWRRPCVDGAAEKRTKCCGVDRSVLCIEHALFVRAQSAAVDAGVGEEPGVVVPVHGDAVAHAELAVTEADSRPEA